MKLVETNLGWFQNETLHSWLANVEQGGMANDNDGIGLRSVWMEVVKILRIQYSFVCANVKSDSWNVKCFEVSHIRKHLIVLNWTKYFIHKNNT